LWDELARRLDPADAELLSAIIIGRQFGLEEALDLLDVDPATPFPLRDRIADVIAGVLQARTPPLDRHREFVRSVARRSEHRVPVFSLNYDMLVEYAAAEEGLFLTDGFTSGSKAAFAPASFSYLISIPSTRRGRPTADRLRGVLNLVKLHGSLGWFQWPDGRIRRIDPGLSIPARGHRLMIPPQRRKHQDTCVPPYSDLWSEFRAVLSNDRSRLVNRLVCVGYGFRDEHVNAIIRSAVARQNFTLVILAKDLEDTVYSTWAQSDRTIIATESRCCVYGNPAAPVEGVWSFEWLAQEVLNNA
jgi:hypothetical protein